MIGKNLIDVVKEKIVKQKKEEEKQRFLLCKLKCIFKNNQKFDGVGYKQFPVCLQALKSVFRKSTRKIDGRKPTMNLTPAMAAKEASCLFSVEERNYDCEKASTEGK